MKRWLWLTVLCLCCGSPLKAATRAIIIGIDRYESSDIANLSYAVADARALGLALTTGLGVPSGNIIVMDSTRQGRLQPTRTNIERVLKQLTLELRPEDTFFLYFSGHGFEKEKETFLATMDASVDSAETLRGTSLPVTLLKDYIGRIQARRAVLIVDACRNDPSSKEVGQNVWSASMTRDLQLAARSVNHGQAGTALLLACMAGERAWEWPERQHGAFTYYLLEGLNGKAADTNGRITAASLADYAHKEVLQWSRQHGKTQTPELYQFGAPRIDLGRLTVFSPPKTPSAPANPLSTANSISAEDLIHTGHLQPLDNATVRGRQYQQAYALKDEVTFALDGKYQYFEALVAIPDDYERPTDYIRFESEGAGRPEQLTNIVVRKFSEPQRVRLRVKGKMRLLIDEDRYPQPACILINPRFEADTKTSSPSTMPPPSETEVAGKKAEDLLLSGTLHPIESTKIKAVEYSEQVFRLREDVVFALDGKYQWFEARLALPDDAERTTDYLNVEVEKDGRWEKAASFTVHKFQNPVRMRIRVVGSMRLTLFEGHWAMGARVVLINPRLLAAD